MLADPTLARTLRTSLVGAGIAAAFACVGCRDAPEVVFSEAKLALQQHDEAGFMALVEPGAHAFLTAATDVVGKSGRVFRVLKDGKPSPALLPKGEVKDVIERGNRAEVIVVQGSQKAIVPMRLVEGQWRIDLLEMTSFQAAVKPQAE
jgi:hypothetical protein